MDPLTRRISAWDGLPILVRERDEGHRLPPVPCPPGLPLRLVLDAVTTILLPAMMALTRAARPGMAVVSLPGLAHAQTLSEPPARAAIKDFLGAGPPPLEDA